MNYSGCSVSYINYNRNNPGQKEMVKMGDALALISLANFRLSLKTNIRVDTIASNWNRLILELKQTFAENSNVMVFEMGIMRSLTDEHYKLLKNWRIAEKWSFLPDKKNFNETDDKGIFSYYCFYIYNFLRIISEFLRIICIKNW